MKQSQTRAALKKSLPPFYKSIPDCHVDFFKHSSLPGISVGLAVCVGMGDVEE